jgi:hypothetical protein
MLHLNVKIQADDLVEDFIYGDREQALQFILAVDLGIADAEFTGQLIIKLWDSLRVDLSDAEEANTLAILKSSPESRGTTSP